MPNPPTPSEAPSTSKPAAIPPRWVLKAVTRIHVLVNSLSGGRLLNKVGPDDVCFITMTGAKSGRRITIPLMYVPWKDGVILVASLGGAPRHPTWYYNLVAHPDIEVLVRSDRLKLRARRASAEEKAEVWPICCDAYPDYAQYQRRTDRDIPVFLCEPRS